MHLDALLADEPLTGGLEPRLGNAHLRMLTIIGFPTATHPGILDELNRLAFPYRWSTRAITARQDRRDQAADQNPPAMVRQAQIHRRDPEGGDDQRGLGPARHRRREQGGRRRRRAAGTRLRSMSAKPMSPRPSPSGTTTRRSPTKSCASSRRSIQGRDFTCMVGDASTPSKPGSARFPAMSTPMSASRRSRRSISPI